MIKSYAQWSREIGTWGPAIESEKPPSIDWIKLAATCRIAEALEKLVAILDPTTLDERMAEEREERERKEKKRERYARYAARIELRMPMASAAAEAAKNRIAEWEVEASVSMGTEERRRLSNAIWPDIWMGDLSEEDWQPKPIETMPEMPAEPPERIGPDKFKYQQRYAVWLAAYKAGKAAKAVR